MQPCKKNTKKYRRFNVIPLPESHPFLWSEKRARTYTHSLPIVGFGCTRLLDMKFHCRVLQFIRPFKHLNLAETRSQDACYRKKWKLQCKGKNVESSTQEVKIEAQLGPIAPTLHLGGIAWEGTETRATSAASQEMIRIQPADRCWYQVYSTDLRFESAQVVCELWSKNKESNQLVALSQVTTQHYQSPDKQSSNSVSTPKCARSTRHSVRNRVLEATQAMPTSRQWEFDTSGNGFSVSMFCVYSVYSVLWMFRNQTLTCCLPRPCEAGTKFPSCGINDRQKSLYKISAQWYGSTTSSHRLGTRVPIPPKGFQCKLHQTRGSSWLSDLHWSTSLVPPAADQENPADAEPPNDRQRLVSSVEAHKSLPEIVGFPTVLAASPWKGAILFKGT